MNPLPNGPRSTVADNNPVVSDHQHGADAGAASDDASASTGSEPPVPCMQQAHDDVMQIDCDDDEDSRRGLKRKWSATSVAEIPTDSDRSAVSSEPEFKRRRASQSPSDSVCKSSSSAIPPAPTWREQARTNLSDKEVKKLLDCFAPGGDREQGLSLLFGPPDQRPAGTFFVCHMPDIGDFQPDLLPGCGALRVSSESAPETYLYASDFDHERWHANLVDVQAKNHYRYVERRVPDLDDDSDDDGSADVNSSDDGSNDVSSSDDYTTDNGSSDDDPNEIIFVCDALLLAIRWGDPALIRTLLDAGADPRRRYQHKKTALHIAAESGNVVVAELLIAALAETLPPGARSADDLVRLDADTCTPLYRAAEAGHYKMCELLLDKGTPAALGAIKDLNNPVPMNDSIHWPILPMQPLFAAIRRGDVALSNLLAVRAKDVDFIDARCDPAPTPAFGLNMTPLQVAAHLGHLPICKTLLALGADIHATCEGKPEALPLAVQAGHIEVARCLLEHGANPYMNRWGGTVLHLHAERDDSPDNSSADMLNLLLDHGIDINQPGPMGETALMLACARDNSAQYVERLLHRGASVHLKDEYGRTALYHAANNISAMELLLEHGADLQTENQGLIALQQAVRHTNLDVVRLLLQHGVSIEHIDGEYDSALQIAIEVSQRCSKTDGAPEAATVLTTLLAQVIRQDNASKLLIGALRREYEPALDDMVLHSYAWFDTKLAPEGDLPFKFKITDFSEFSNDVVEYLGRAQEPTSSDGLRVPMLSCGLTQPVKDLLMPFIDAYPDMEAALTGHIRGAHAFLAPVALHGWLASMEAVLSRPAEEWRPYPDFRYGADKEAILTKIARGAITRLVEGALAAEEAFVAHTYAELFESCLAQMPQPWVIDGQLAPLQLAKDALAHKLIERGIYASMAERIEDAWKTAWTDTASTATGRSGSTVVDRQIFDPNSLSGDLADLAEWFFADPQPVKPTPPTPLAFADSPPGDALLQAFRRTLRANINLSSSNILKLPGAEQLPQEKAAAAQGVYETLMMRQLHMLAQFIDPGMLARETQEYAQRVQRLATSSAAMT